MEPLKRWVRGVHDMWQTLLKRELRVALIPVIVFAVCWVVALVNRGTLEGSAFDGYVRDGKYVLSLGHGHFQETSQERFATIRRRERIVFVCLGMMTISGIASVVLI